jgi:hypothetical protein
VNESQYQRALAACHAAQAKGIKVVREDWGVEATSVGWDPGADGCACAIGCMLVIEEAPITDPHTGYGIDQEAAGALLLGATNYEIGAFTIGFDGDPCPEEGSSYGYPEWHEAGRRLAVELGLGS